MARGRRIRAPATAWVLALLLGSGVPVARSDEAAPAAAGDPTTAARTAARASGPAAPGAGSPRAYLIYLINAAEPMVVKHYVEEGDEIRFEKYGGWVGIPRYEVLRIVPDEPAAPPPAQPPPAVQPLPAAQALPAAGADARLSVTTRSGSSFRATAVTEEGTRVRMRTREGSLTMPRTDLVGVLRVPATPAAPEAWLWLATSHEAPAPWVGAHEDRPATAGAPAHGPAVDLPFPPLSDRPHLLELAGGEVIQIDGFWIEDGQIRFRRLGGVVGFALGEVSRLLPQDLAPTGGRVPVQLVRRLGPDRLEARIGRALERIRLIGVEPIPGASGQDDPWAPLSAGLMLQLEFDRQRYDPGGDWLAYVYLPSGRMLNAELIRAGLARPRPDERNLRYADLLQEVWLAARPGGDQ
jgi:hypothetical protein